LKRRMQTAALRGTNTCSQIVGQPVMYPRPLVPRIVIPLQIEATISIVKTQKPRLLPARK